jgi:hypothetical protein
MNSDFWLAVGIAGGAVAGFGIYLMAIQFAPSTPALGPALRRLHPSAGPMVGAPSPPSSIWPPRFVLPAADLAILSRTPEQHLLSLGLSGAIVLVLPVLLAVLSVVVGFTVPVVIPVAGTLVLVTAAMALAHADMVAKAKSARAEFVRALCTYAALTAHQVRSGHGAVEAMERSASICDGWPYVRLRTALLAAQLQMRPPWDELKVLSAEIDLVELETFSDIMRSAGTDGAQVYQTMRAQAASLRDQLRVRDLEKAKTRTSKLDIPATALIIILLVLVGYPMMVNLLNQS